MREIKFRVWDKKTKKMRQLVNIVFNAGFGVEPNNNTIKLIWVKGKDIIEDKDIQIQREDNFELMQFTGLHDKNGKEIYEGDIVSNGYEKCIVVWVKEYAGFMLKLINKEYEDKEWTNPMIDLRNDEEVIGNIYENSDLLKGADNIE